MCFYKASYKRRCTWVNPLVLFIPSLLGMYVYLKRHCMVLNKPKESGFIGLTHISYTLVLFVVRLTLPIYFANSQRKNISLCYMWMILLSQEVFISCFRVGSTTWKQVFYERSWPFKLLLRNWGEVFRRWNSLKSKQVWFWDVGKERDDFGKGCSHSFG